MIKIIIINRTRSKIFVNYLEPMSPNSISNMVSEEVPMVPRFRFLLCRTTPPWRCIQPLLSKRKSGATRPPERLTRRGMRAR